MFQFYSKTVHIALSLKI